MFLVFKNLSVMTVQATRIKCAVIAYTKMSGNMQQNLDGRNHNQKFPVILTAMRIMFLRIL